MVTPAPPAMSLPRRNTTAPLSAALVDLFARLDRCPGPPSIRDLDRILKSAPLELADILPHTATDKTSYVRTLIRLTEHYEALVMCWLPGQQSPVHDHGGSACAVRVVQGAATETRYCLAADGLADSTDHSVYRAGEVVCSFDADIHTLANIPVPGEEHHWPVALVTLHIYAPHLKSSRKYLARTPSKAGRA